MAASPTRPDRWRVGVAVGKFNPPHMGHAHLLTTGAQQVETLHVLLCDRPDQTLPARDRAAWLVDAVPGNVVVHITPDDLPEANGPWADRALKVLPVPPDVAFTSEPWGPGWAATMGAAHVDVDQARATHPISGSALRADLARHFHHLVPAARAALVRRIVVVGAESTGKTTIAEALAAELQTTWVPEHGRAYWHGRRHLAEQSWDPDEFLRIADAQSRMEDDLARRAVGGVMVADTDALVTAVWAHRYTGQVLPALHALAARRRPDHYLLCAPDVPWVQDGTRESEGHRTAMHERTLQAVTASGVPRTLLAGTAERRLATAIAVADDLRRSLEVLT